MSPGRKRLRRIQLGQESSNGTAVACTTIWRGMGDMLDDQRKIEEIEELAGYLDGADRTVTTYLKAGIDFAETAATPEQFGYFLIGALGMSKTGVADGIGTDFIYTATIPTTAAPTTKALTIRAGDDFAAEAAEYCVVTKFSLSGKAGEGVKMGGSWIGRQVASTTFTGALSLPAVSELATSLGKVYIDAIGGTYGTTQVANAILGFKIDVEIQWAEKPTMDGNLYYSYLVYAGHKVTGSLTFEHDTAGATAKTDWRALTAKKLQVKLEGDAVATPGTTYSKKAIIYNGPLKYSKVAKIGEQNGNDILDVSWRSRYNATAGDQGQFIVVNELAALP